MTTSLCISHPMPGFTDTVRSSPQRLTSSSLLILTNLEPGNTPCADLSTYVITPAPGHQHNWAHTWHCQTAAAFQLYHSAPDNYTTHFVYKNILWLMKKSFKSFQLIEEMKNLFLIISASASQHVWQWILIEDSETSLCNNIYSTEETTCCMWSWVSRCWIQFPVIKYINPVWSSCSLLNVCSCLQSYLIREFYNRSVNNHCGVLIDNLYFA